MTTGRISCLDELVIAPNATRPAPFEPIGSDQDMAEACDAIYETADGHPLEDDRGRMPYQRGYTTPRRPDAAAGVLELVAARRTRRSGRTRLAEPAQPGSAAGDRKVAA